MICCNLYFNKELDNSPHRQTFEIGSYVAQIESSRSPFNFKPLNGFLIYGFGDERSAQTGSPMRDQLGPTLRGVVGKSLEYDKVSVVNRDKPYLKLYTSLSSVADLHEKYEENSRSFTPKGMSGDEIYDLAGLMSDWDTSLLQVSVKQNVPTSKADWSTIYTKFTKTKGEAPADLDIAAKKYMTYEQGDALRQNYAKDPSLSMIPDKRDIAIALMEAWVTYATSFKKYENALGTGADADTTKKALQDYSSATEATTLIQQYAKDKALASISDTTAQAAAIALMKAWAPKPSDYPADWTAFISQYVKMQTALLDSRTATQQSKENSQQNADFANGVHDVAQGQTLSDAYTQDAALAKAYSDERAVAKALMSGWLTLLGQNTTETQWDTLYKSYMAELKGLYLPMPRVIAWADGNARYALGEYTGYRLREIFSLNAKLFLDPANPNGLYIQGQYLDGFQEATPTARSRQLLVLFGFSITK